MTEVSTKVIGLRLKVSINAAVAQRIRASVYGTEGRGFESLQPHHPHLQLGPRKRRLIVIIVGPTVSSPCTYRCTYRLSRLRTNGFETIRSIRRITSYRMQLLDPTLLVISIRKCSGIFQEKPAIPLYSKIGILGHARYEKRIAWIVNHNFTMTKQIGRAAGSVIE